MTRTLSAIAAIASVAAALAFALRRRRGLSAEADGHEPSPVDPWLVASRDDAWASVELPQNEAHAKLFPLEETQPWNS